jgi:hypothetical protein
VGIVLYYRSYNSYCNYILAEGKIMKHLIAIAKIPLQLEVEKGAIYVIPKGAEDVCIGNEVFIELFENYTARRAHDQGRFLVKEKIMHNGQDVGLKVEMI